MFSHSMLARSRVKSSGRKMMPRTAQEPLRTISKRSLRESHLQKSKVKKIKPPKKSKSRSKNNRKPPQTNELKSIARSKMRRPAFSNLRKKPTSARQKKESKESVKERRLSNARLKKESAETKKKRSVKSKTSCSSDWSNSSSKIRDRSKLPRKFFSATALSMSVNASASLMIRTKDQSLPRNSMKSSQPTTLRFCSSVASFHSLIRLVTTK